MLVLEQNRRIHSARSQRIKVFILYILIRIKTIWLKWKSFFSSHDITNKLIEFLVLSEPPEPAAPKKISGGSLDRDISLAEVEKEKRNSFVKAWEESEKSKAENKAQKKISEVGAWENSKKAALEAKLRTIEEQLEKKKAEYGEKTKNKIALIHKEAEEKRAVVEARRGEEVLKAEEMAAKFRATGQTPKKWIGCF
ncbi:hypothetical protein K2173_025298 [Erythroxylum novogranatense]|uniref:Remorin C-terminal domain-containing protein n=1 Tax=Erythroxylum novogranatense TaxID=1862640 RepID=A0AAV8UIM9_9ROSI|nr:hypothetical protein K2173_025298 [Erythroxylum novogranatense]